MKKDFSVGDRVVLKSFNNINCSPSKVRDGDNYWLLIGCKGAVVLLNGVVAHQMGVNGKDKRVLIQFDKNLSDFGLSCHNELPNSLWILVSDLEQQAD